MPESNPPSRRFGVSAEDAGERVDRFLAARLPELSRTRIQQEIARGNVRLSGHSVKPSRRLAAGESIELSLAPESPAAAMPEAIALDVLYEDEDFAAINKPAGIVVHPGAGIRSGTLVNALLHRYGELSSIGGPDRPGIVHRLDKGTSGVLLIARNNQAHQRLARQFHSRRAEKTYLVLVHGLLEHDTGRISLAVARDLRRRTRMTTRRLEGRPSLTTWRVIARLCPGLAPPLPASSGSSATGHPGQRSKGGDRALRGAPEPSAGWAGAQARMPVLPRGRKGSDPRRCFTLVEARLHTGRTHQIRVHFSALGHPVAGDAVYGAPRRIRLDHEEIAPPGRPWLHSARIGLAHPRTGLRVEIRAPLPADLLDWLRALVYRLGGERAAIDPILRPYL